jgi:hypothetical protein
LSPRWNEISFSSDIFCVVTSLAVDSLNLFWFYKILLGSIKHTRELKKKD